MTVTLASPFRAAPTISREGWLRVLRDSGSLAAVPLWRGCAELYDSTDEAAAALYDYIVSAGHDPNRWLAIGMREHRLGTDANSVLWRNDTRSWTNARSVRHPAIKRSAVVITDSVRKSNYVRYANVFDSVTDGIYRLEDPSYVYVERGADTIGEVFALWTEDPEEYGAFVVRFVNEHADLTGEEPPVGTPYDHIIRGLIDARSQLSSRRPNEGGVPRGPYETVPLDRKRGVVVHYRGVVTPADAGLASFQADAVYHVGKNWSRAGETPVFGSGIMYHVGIDGEGRKYLLRDLDRVLWHCGAWPQNADTLAIQLPLGGQQRATEVQLQSLREVVDDWCAFSRTPRDQVWGHQQLSQTDCPGTLMRDFVTPYRASAPPSPPASVPRVPPTMPDPWRHEAGGNRYGEFWVAAPFVQWINAHGGFWAMGHVVAGAFEAEDTGIYTQPFEGGMLEWNPDNPPEYRVLRRHCGVEVMRAKFPQHAPHLRPEAA